MLQLISLKAQLVTFQTKKQNIQEVDDLKTSLTLAAEAGNALTESPPYNHSKTFLLDLVQLKTYQEERRPVSKHYKNNSKGKPVKQSSEAAMANTDERKFLLEVIEVYHSLPALWDNKWKDYSNRIKKNEQYDELLQKYNERYPEADRKALVKKINSLRTNFRKEFRHIKNSEKRKSGAETDEVLEPTLWYFDEMKFLIDLEEPQIPC
ncbi:hypothetical protein J6590_027483 [Homalodisca vitripennis]|nr:hypothetical protein J6590_027483 [Homalodisca vitripennis]